MPTLADIRSKVRKITARDSTQLSDSSLDDYINTYYRYDLPAELRLLKLHDFYTFTTQPNVDVYAFDSENYSYVEPLAKIGGYQSSFTTDPSYFEALRPRLAYNLQIATGDGTSGPYTGTLTTVPFHRSYNTSGSSGSFPSANPIGVSQMVVFSAKTSDSQMLVATDNPTVTGSGTSTRYSDSGTFTGDVALPGSINYISGEYSITFSASIPEGEPIYAQVTNYSASRPMYVLFYQNQFTLSPVPDGAYTVQIPAFRTPSALANSGSSPELNELWQLLAVGAALKIFEDTGDLDSYSQYVPIFKRYEAVCRNRSNIQSTRNRIPTIYSGPTGPADEGVTYFQGY